MRLKLSTTRKPLPVGAPDEQPAVIGAEIDGREAPAAAAMRFDLGPVLGMPREPDHAPGPSNPVILGQKCGGVESALRKFSVPAPPTRGRTLVAARNSAC